MKFMQYTNEQLKRTLAKMLPEKVYYDLCVNKLFYKGEVEVEVLDTELLHLCWLVEASLDEKKLHYTYAYHIYNDVVPLDVQPFRATWQQRTIALAKTLGIEIV